MRCAFSFSDGLFFCCGFLSHSGTPQALRPLFSPLQCLDHLGSASRGQEFEGARHITPLFCIGTVVYLTVRTVKDTLVLFYFTAQLILDSLLGINVVVLSDCRLIVCLTNSWAQRCALPSFLTHVGLVYSLSLSLSRLVADQTHTRRRSLQIHSLLLIHVFNTVFFSFSPFPLFFSLSPSPHIHNQSRNDPPHCALN